MPVGLDAVVPDLGSSEAADVNLAGQPHEPMTDPTVSTVAALPAVSNVVSPLPEPSAEVSQNSVPHVSTKPHRVFLDICCGHRGPLSSAVH